MSVNAEFIERYQLEYEKNPQSRVFAPLAEAYRKMGWLDEAERISKRGVQMHSDFAGGRVAYAKVLIDRRNFAEAHAQLEKATQLSPDNLLAHTLMGETLLELRRPKDALKAFKMVLFLNPQDEKARAAVRKWEFLTADEYEDSAFPKADSVHDDEQDDDQDEEDRFEKMILASGDGPSGDTRLDLAQRHARALERVISLADAFTVRSDLEAALKVLEDGQRLLGPMPEIEKRLKLLAKRTQVFDALVPKVERMEVPPEIADEIRHHKTVAFFEPLVDPLKLSPVERDLKREKLQLLLRRIENRRA